MQRAIFPISEELALKEEFLGPRPGFFVEVGANDPVIESQSWHLEQRGWRGVLVEAQSELAEALRRTRKSQVFAVACSSPENAGKTMELAIAGRFTSLNHDHFVPDMERAGMRTVPVMTLDAILEEAAAPCPLDFVSIDVETHEIEVLEGFNLGRWRPRLLLVEDIVQSLDLHRYLMSRGYKWVRRTGINAWYIPGDALFPVSLFGRWQFLRKYYLGLPFRRLRNWGRRVRHRQSGRQKTV